MNIDEGLQISMAKQANKLERQKELLEKLGFAKIEFYNQKGYTEAFLTPDDSGKNGVYKRFSINLKTGNIRLLISKHPDGTGFKSFDGSKYISPTVLEVVKKIKHFSQKNEKDFLDHANNRTVPGTSKAILDTINKLYTDKKYKELKEIETKAEHEYFRTEYKEGKKGPKYEAWRKAKEEVRNYKKAYHKNIENKKNAFKNQEIKNSNIDYSLRKNSFFNY